MKSQCQRTRCTLLRPQCPLSWPGALVLRPRTHILITRVLIGTTMIPCGLIASPREGEAPTIKATSPKCAWLLGISPQTSHERPFRATRLESRGESLQLQQRGNQAVSLDHPCHNPVLALRNSSMPRLFFKHSNVPKKPQRSSCTSRLNKDLRSTGRCTNAAFGLRSQSRVQSAGGPNRRHAIGSSDRWTFGEGTLLKGTWDVVGRKPRRAMTLPKEATPPGKRGRT